MPHLPAVVVADVACDEVFQLAEGPRWDARRNRLLWVDIDEGRVVEGILSGGWIDITGDHEFDGTTGAVAVTEDGGLLVAAGEGLFLVSEGDSRVVAGPRLLPTDAGRRLNDGATDPAGRFLVGSLTIGGPERFAEELFLVHPDGQVRVVDSDLSLSNGLAWSVDGMRLYSTDTLRGTVWQRDYDPLSGTYGERRVFLQIGEGHPDGCAIDAEDHLWVAHWGIGEARRFSPDGTLVARVVVDAPNVSAVCLAGHDLRTLVITTASVELEPEQLAAHPNSGRLFAVRVDVPGLVPVPARVTWASA